MFNNKFGHFRKSPKKQIHTWYGQDQPARVLVAGVAREPRQVLHAAEFEVLETVEREASVRHHPQQGGHEAAVEGARAPLLSEDGGGGVRYARVHVLTRHLQINQKDKRLA